MRHRTLPVVVAFVIACGAAKADEGMWRPSQMPQLAAQLKARGLKLDPASLSNLAGKQIGRAHV